ncbi:MAG: murein L,D-transpeptidase catalytic domain family protein [Sediminibacterium sp.]|nr:murein L,D-transpeptidase catalytic domain family protein [Sediminibacterium sp.]
MIRQITRILLIVTWCGPVWAQKSGAAQRLREALLFCQKNNLNTDYCFLVNLGVHSGKNRFEVWNFTTAQLVYSGLCCHGYGGASTETAPEFSNKTGSNCTASGKYKTGKRAYSNWGINVHYKLHGLEKTNSNAYKRIIVLHSYDQVPEKEIYPSHLPLGWSMGCPVIDNALMKKVDVLLKKSRKPVLLWIYN